jgi:hypothetical protein
MSMLAEEPEKIEVTDAEQEAKTRLYWCGRLESSEKNSIFSAEEVFFLLTYPLMGDPNPLFVFHDLVNQQSRPIRMLPKSLIRFIRPIRPEGYFNAFSIYFSVYLTQKC